MTGDAVLDDLLDALKQKAMLVTHPRHKRVLLDAIDEIRLSAGRSEIRNRKSAA
jgi:hypothetical protein